MSRKVWQRREWKRGVTEKLPDKNLTISVWQDNRSDTVVATNSDQNTRSGSSVLENVHSPLCCTTCTWVLWTRMVNSHRPFVGRWCFCGRPLQQTGPAGTPVAVWVGCLEVHLPLLVTSLYMQHHTMCQKLEMTTFSVSFRSHWQVRLFLCMRNAVFNILTRITRSIAKKSKAIGSQAVRRFLTLERSLHMFNIIAVMQEYLVLGHAEAVPAQDWQGSVYGYPCALCTKKSQAPWPKSELRLPSQHLVSRLMTL